MTPMSKHSSITDDRTVSDSASSREKWVDRLLTWVVAIGIAWATMQVRVAVLEERANTQDTIMRQFRDDVRADMQEIRDDVKTLLRRVP